MTPRDSAREEAASNECDVAHEIQLCAVAGADCIVVLAVITGRPRTAAGMNEHTVFAPFASVVAEWRHGGGGRKHRQGIEQYGQCRTWLFSTLYETLRRLSFFRHGSTDACIFVGTRLSIHLPRLDLSSI